MNSVYNLKLAGYAVEYVDLRAARPRERHTATAVVTLDTVKAAQIVGEDLTEVIRRRYESRGYHVLSVQKAGRCTVPVNLSALYAAARVIADGEGQP